MNDHLSLTIYKFICNSNKISPFLYEQSFVNKKQAAKQQQHKTVALATVLIIFLRLHFNNHDFFTIFV